MLEKGGTVGAISAGSLFLHEYKRRKVPGPCGSVLNNLAAEIHGGCQVEADREFLVTPYPKMEVLI